MKARRLHEDLRSIAKTGGDLSVLAPRLAKLRKGAGTLAPSDAASRAKVTALAAKLQEIAAAITGVTSTGGTQKKTGKAKEADF